MKTVFSRNHLVSMSCALVLYLSLSTSTVYANQIVDGALFEPVYTTDQINISVAENDGEQLLRTHYKVVIKDANIAAIKNSIFGVKALAVWFDEVSSANLVDKKSAIEQRAELVIAMPFPLSDRVVTMTQHIVTETESSLRIHLTANYTDLEISDSYFRMPKFDGEWHARQVGANVLLEYLAIYNPRLESLPRSFVINNIKKSAKAYINKMSSINSHDF